MALKTINDAILTSIANAIRSKLNVATTYKPNQMAAAIGSIETPNLDTLDVTDNGTYTPESPYNGFSEVDVSVVPSFGPSDEGKVVSEGQLVAQTSKNIGSNGTHDTTLNNQVVVAVTPNLQEKTARQNGNVLPDSGYDGLSKVVVDVSGGGGGGLIASWDFKTSLLDTVNGLTATLSTSGASQSASGVSITGGKGAIRLPKSVFAAHRTFEIDVGDMTLDSMTNHHRFFMPTYNSGFIYRNNGYWSIYSGSWATDSTISDYDEFANSTVKIFIDLDSKWHIYKDGVLLYEPTFVGPSVGDYLMLGSTDNYSCIGTVFEGFRVYEGFHQ